MAWGAVHVVEIAYHDDLIQCMRMIFSFSRKFKPVQCFGKKIYPDFWDSFIEFWRRSYFVNKAGEVL